MVKPGGGACAQHCVCVCRCLSLGLRKLFSKTIHMHATLRPPSVTLCLLPSLTPNSFISLSLFNKAPIHCPANQSLHSCSQLSMTRFIWLGPCRSHQLSSFSILLVWKRHWKPDYHSESQRHKVLGLRWGSRLQLQMCLNMSHFTCKTQYLIDNGQCLRTVVYAFVILHTNTSNYNENMLHACPQPWQAFWQPQLDRLRSQAPCEYLSSFQTLKLFFSPPPPKKESYREWLLLKPPPSRPDRLLRVFPLSQFTKGFLS